MGTYHEGITLSGEDLDRVNGQCLCVDAIDFDDGHGMVIDGENVVRVAGDRDQTESITGTKKVLVFKQVTNKNKYTNYLPFVAFDINYSKLGIRGPRRRASKTVDEGSIGGPTLD